jgi:hypothetical protein
MSLYVAIPTMAIILKIQGQSKRTCHEKYAYELQCPIAYHSTDVVDAKVLKT